MAKEENSVITRFVNLCHLFMMELGMPNIALQELLIRAHATTTAELESFKSVKHWDSLTAKVCDVGAQIATGPYNPNFKIPDLNYPEPRDDDEGSSAELVIVQDHGKMVEARATSTARKRKTTQANHSIKKPKFTRETAAPSTCDKGKGILEMEETAGPSTRDRGKRILEMESWGEN